LPAHVVGSALQFAGGLTVFKPEELKALKALGPLGINLLGFRSKAFLKTSYQMKAPMFCRPTDKVTKGSVQAFATLHQQMLARNKIAVAVVRATDAS